VLGHRAGDSVQLERFAGRTGVRFHERRVFEARVDVEETHLQNLCTCSQSVRLSVEDEVPGAVVVVVLSTIGGAVLAVARRLELCSVVLGQVGQVGSVVEFEMVESGSAELGALFAHLADQVANKLRITERCDWRASNSSKNYADTY
jgi:hypothetical protein